MSLANNLKKYRKRLGLTQKELSEKSGISCNSIINYENNRRISPPSSVLQKLAQALNVRVDDLLSEDLGTHYGMRWFTSVESAPVDDWEEFVAERGEQDIVEQITEYIKMLNRYGAAEAVKRVAELTEIPKYRA